MTDLERIKNEVAVENGFETWAKYVADKEFLYCTGVDESINEAMQRYAELILEKAGKRVEEINSFEMSGHWGKDQELIANRVRNTEI